MASTTRDPAPARPTIPGVFALSAIRVIVRAPMTAEKLAKIRSCNAEYGKNGWLGIAQIWLYSDGTIAQGTAKMNDSYFNSAPYNTAAWKQMVVCQEIAHDFGLDHQDENSNNANLGSCMDYTNDPDGGAGGASSSDPANTHPNSHDYQQLDVIYGGSVSSSAGSSLPAAAQGQFNERAEWGRLVRSSADGRLQVFERDLGAGSKVLTHVVWAEPRSVRP